MKKYLLPSLNPVSEWDKSQDGQPWRGQLRLPPGRLGAVANLQHQNVQDPFGEVELSGRETCHLLHRTGADSSFPTITISRDSRCPATPASLEVCRWTWSSPSTQEAPSPPMALSRSTLTSKLVHSTSFPTGWTTCSMRLHIAWDPVQRVNRRGRFLLKLSPLCTQLTTPTIATSIAECT